MRSLPRLRRSLSIIITTIIIGLLTGLCIQQQRSKLDHESNDARPSREVSSNQSSNLALPLSAALSKPDPATQMRINQGYGKLPLSFEVNSGQVDSKVKYISRGNGYSLFLTATEAVLSLRHGKDQNRSENAVLRMQLVGGNDNSEVVGESELAGKSNYFIGNDPAQWRTDVSQYNRVRYQDVYPGIDMVYYGNQRELEYDLIVSPGADPDQIKLHFEGASKIEIDDQGELVLTVNGGEVRKHKPIVYQNVDGEKRLIAGNYFVKGENEFGFKVEEYDVSASLVIDPVLSYSTYLGGSGYDQGQGIAVDNAGNAYITGFTNSLDFPIANSFQSNCNNCSTSPGLYDVFITKINAFGNALIYSTYLGGSATDQSLSIVVDNFGNAYITGNTNSTDFPVVNALQGTCNGCSTTTGSGDCFIIKLNPLGNAITFSTFLGGGNNDYPVGVEINNIGEVFVAGNTSSIDFPITSNIYQSSPAGIFLTKLSSDGSSLIFSTYFGGSNGGAVSSFTIDPLENMYLTGGPGDNFPITAGAFQSTPTSIFITKFNPTGSALIYSTYLGGTLLPGSDQSTDIAVDSSGNAYITGNTSSMDFPTVNPFQDNSITNFFGGTFAFLTKLNSSGSDLLYSTYLGGKFSGFTAVGGSNIAVSISVDSAKNAYITGYTSNSDFPTLNSLQNNPAGLLKTFITKFNSAGNGLVFSTYFGGSNNSDFPFAISTDINGNAYITGFAGSLDFPTTLDAVQSKCKSCSIGPGDTFITKITPVAGNFQLGATTYITDEEDGNIVITVNRLNGADVPASIQYSTSDNQAKSPADFAATSGTLTFDAGELSKTFSIPINDDSLNEANESLNIRLTNSTNGATLGNQSVAVLTILDNDPSPTLSISDASVTEGNNGISSLIFPVDLSVASGQTVTVNYSTSGGSASSGSDYIANTGSLIFPPGTTTQNITVLINSDTMFEPDETLQIHLTNPINASLTSSQATGTIVNDDGMPSISINDVSVTEGNSGTINAVFTVSLSATSGQPISLQYATADRSTTAGSDYIGTSGTLIFPAGVLSQTINVQIKGDTLNEPDETFLINLTNANNATIADNQGIGTIIDDDGPPDISISNISIIEGNSGTTSAVFTITLSTVSSDTITVNYATANGTATAGSDYVAASGTAILFPGMMSQTFTINVNGDSTNEPNETFLVNLTNASSANILTSQATGTIINDDSPATITSFTPASGPVGTNVMINGTGLIGVSAVKFNNVVAAFTVVSDTQITAIVPAGATTGRISITKSTTTIMSSTNFTVSLSISGFSPASGPVTTSVTIAGSSFTSITSVKFGGVTATFTTLSATSIRATVPAAAITGPITVTNATGTATSSSNFVVLPAVTSFTPNSGAVGTSITITGSGFTGVNGVQFNGVTASFTIVSATSIKATVPTGATTGLISLTTPSGTTTSATSFTVLPKIDGFTPASGPIGTSVIINGTNFTGVTSVKFNNLGATFSLSNDSQIIATVPTGATTGKISITNPVGTATSTASFTVTATVVSGYPDHTTIYVADSNNNRIQRSTDDGVTWSMVGAGLGTTIGHFRGPRGVAANSTDSIIFIADTLNNRIQRSTDGGNNWQIIALVGTTAGKVNGPQGLAYDEINDRLYIADTLNNRIQVAVNAASAAVPTITIFAATSLGNTVGKFNQPRGIAVDAAGYVYVADTGNNRIQKNINGSSTGWTIFAGATLGSTIGKVNAPRGIYVDSANRVYIADTGNNRIQVNNDGGVAGWSILMATGTAIDSVMRPEGVVVTSGGNIFVGDTGNNRVQKRLSNNQTVIVGSTGSGPNQFNQPAGLR